MRAAASLRWRLLGLTALAAVLIVGLACGLLASLFRDTVTRQFASTLVSQLDQVTARLEPGDAAGVQLDPKALSDPRWTRPYSGLYWQVDGPSAAGVLRARSLWDAQLQAPPDALADGAVHVHEIPGPNGAALLLVERSVRFEGSGPWRVLVAAERREMDATLRRFNATLALALAALLGLLALAAWAQVGIGLAPLRRLQAALAALRAGQAQRIEGQYPSELQPLVQGFNQVLTQQAEGLARARTQAGNLAHALKTPLAVLQQAAEQAGPGEAALAVLVAEQVRQARRQVDWHLARARAAAAQAQPGLHTPIAPAAAGLLRVLARVHAERGLQFDASALPDLAFAGEAQDLQEMLGNLLDNACHWAGRQVRLSGQLQGERLCLRVEDDGPGIPPAQRAQALARGGRLDENLPGSGLGLAIVAELAALYGGRLRLGDAALGGLCAELELPAFMTPRT